MPVNFTWALSEGLVTTVLGMIIVFIVLVLLIVILQAVGNFFASSKPKEESAELMQFAPVEEISVPEVIVADDTILVAVIAAAIAAYSGRQVSDIKVSSIRRLASVETGWAAQARRDLIDVRRSLN